MELGECLVPLGTESFVLQLLSKNMNTEICIAISLPVELGLSHWGRNIGWGCSRIGCWGIFGPLRDTVTGRWRRLQNENLYDLYCSPITMRVIKSRRTRWVEQVGRMGGKDNVHKGFCWENLLETSLGRPTHRRENNIKMDLQELEWGYELHSSGSGCGQETDSCKSGNELSGVVSRPCPDGERIVDVGGGGARTLAKTWLWRTAGSDNNSFIQSIWSLNKDRPTWCHLLYYFTIYCSTCFECYYIHLPELATYCGFTSCVVLLWFDVCWCYGVVRLGWYPYADWSTASACIRIPHHPNRTTPQALLQPA